MEGLIDIVDAVFLRRRWLEEVRITVLPRRDIEAYKAHLANGNWYPACGGSETEFKSRGGHRLLYCWQPSTGRHAYINLDTDIVLTDEEARATLGTW
jgi:hypothetical protein